MKNTLILFLNLLKSKSIPSIQMKILGLLKKWGENAYNYYSKNFDKDKCISQLENVMKNEIKKAKNNK